MKKGRVVIWEHRQGWIRTIWWRKKDISGKCDMCVTEVVSSPVFRVIASSAQSTLDLICTNFEQVKHSKVQLKTAKQYLEFKAIFKG